MLANRILLQKKYARVVKEFARQTDMPLEQALDFFYHSWTYQEMSQGIADMHCRSDLYLVDELKIERSQRQRGDMEKSKFA